MIAHLIIKIITEIMFCAGGGIELFSIIIFSSIRLILGKVLMGVASYKGTRISPEVLFNNNNNNNIKSPSK